MSFDASRARPALPDIDDRLAPPETCYEVYDGELVYVPPADPPHATRHSKISALVEAHAGLEFEVASDMLTRLTDVDDKAPDVSVFPLAPDPQTGRRQIEQLAFEVVSTESIGRAGIKAGQLVARGVRRVFAVDVERSRALEWSAALGTWSVLDPDGHIEDPALGAPLPIGDLVHAAKADDSMARALIAKRNPVIEAVRAQDRAEGKAKGLAEGKAKGLAEGKAKGKAEALVDVLALRNLPVDDAARSRILGEQDLARLQRWLSRAMTCATVAELFAEP
ncbi:MAG TPA: Uma2 family endonuclease [Kofleriaceae bacterium]|jgi:Uma2 family endonuclease|nr:Uma2 family endonuclease [Kofleriaceae bacterium]